MSEQSLSSQNRSPRDPVASSSRPHVKSSRDFAGSPSRPLVKSPRHFAEPSSLHTQPLRTQPLSTHFLPVEVGEIPPLISHDESLMPCGEASFYNLSNMDSERHLLLRRWHLLLRRWHLLLRRWQQGLFSTKRTQKPCQSRVFFHNFGRLIQNHPRFDHRQRNILLSHS